tara:strand:- start:120 stop:416 length:297 start_codon:yes stop_codon:yes gene_type:complete
MESGRGTVMVRVCLDLVGLGIDIFGECVGVTPFPASLDEEDPHNEQDKTEDDGKNEWKTGICKHMCISVSTANTWTPSWLKVFAVCSVQSNKMRTGAT